MKHCHSHIWPSFNPDNNHGLKNYQKESAPAKQSERRIESPKGDLTTCHTDFNQNL